MQKEKIANLERIAYNLRVDCLRATTEAGSGHLTSCLSAADIMAVLLFDTMSVDLQAFKNPNNDRFILSKGHAAPVLYAAYKELGLLTEQELLSLRKFDSSLEGHPTARFKFHEAATGSLGQGLSIGVGIALSAVIDKRDFITYVLLGDSELAEGSIWEAAELAAYYKLNNIVAIADINRLGQSTETMIGHHIENYKKKFEAFGWFVLMVDGHSVPALLDVFEQAKKEQEKPVMILAYTIKGYGLDSIADKNGYHGKAFKHDELPGLLKELETKFPAAAHYTGHIDIPHKPPRSENAIDVYATHSKLDDPVYQKGQKIATRKAFGEALRDLGAIDESIVVLDAEVKNSTYTEYFERLFPSRFIECFVAEQNMIGIAVGLSTRGKKAYAATFGAFFTRAFDQVRMAAIGGAALKLCGSHAGVSIGEDGPSQMALEDIGMMRSLVDSVVLYPCDAVSTYKLTELMNTCTTISYLRTTRMDTPVLYDNQEVFELGGCKILKQSPNDNVTVIAAGITVIEALKAYELLMKEQIAICVIDLYSIKPFDKKTVLACAQQTNNKLLIVEDHYKAGGIGEMVMSDLANEGLEFAHLYVSKMPRSGKPAELLAFEEIDYLAIISKIKNIINAWF